MWVKGVVGIGPGIQQARGYSQFSVLSGIVQFRTPLELIGKIISLLSTYELPLQVPD